MVVVALIVAAVAALWMRESPSEQNELRPVALSQEARDALLQARMQEVMRTREAKKASRASRRKALVAGNAPPEGDQRGYSES